MPPLPTSVFAIRTTDDHSQYQQQERKCCKLVDVGEGNNHQFEMAKGLSKALVQLMV